MGVIMHMYSPWTGKERKEVHEFEDGLGYICTARPWLKKQKQKNRPTEMLWSAQTQHAQCHPKYCRKHRTTLKFHGLCLIIHILIANIKVNVDERSQLKGTSHRNSSMLSYSFELNFSCNSASFGLKWKSVFHLVRLKTSIIENYEPNLCLWL